jgi:hypothetical protein
MFAILAGGPRSPAHVDLSRPDGLAYWTEKLAVDEPTLRGAVQAVGFTARDVRDYLQWRQSAGPAG